MSSSSSIVLIAFNARYAHTAFGARYLLANLGDLKEQSSLLEFDLTIQPRTAVEKILATNPKVVALGCYIWNIDLVTQVASLLKTVRPDLKLVLGGPEISFETEDQEIFKYADHVICGEGEVEFSQLCATLLDDSNISLPAQIIRAAPVDLAEIELPYDLYSETDLAHRILYVETSRGCPFRCEYCMSSLDSSVRTFPKEKLFSAFETLIERGARIFKFVDRTFNLDIAFSLEIMAFFKARYQSGMMLHFEMIPDRLPDSLLEAISDLPDGMLQFEIGIQTFNPEVAKRIQRPLNIPLIETNMRRLRAETSVHIHSDLIAGLPGEDLDSFAAGFDRLFALQPQEIQLGILKRLRGAPIDRHSQGWGMVYAPHAPYEILKTNHISFKQMQELSRFARFWNLTVNNGQFIQTAPLIWQNEESVFGAFMKWSNWLYIQTNSTAHIALLRFAHFLITYLVEVKHLSKKQVLEAVAADYQRGNRTDLPAFLKPYARSADLEIAVGPALPSRQARHQTKTVKEQI